MYRTPRELLAAATPAPWGHPGTLPFSPRDLVNLNIGAVGGAAHIRYVAARHAEPPEQVEATAVLLAVARDTFAALVDIGESTYSTQASDVIDRARPVLAKALQLAGTLTGAVAKAVTYMTTLAGDVALPSTDAMEGGLEPYQRKQGDIREWDAWRRRAAKRMPALAARVFALRGKPYPGCGGHHEIEGRLGKLIALICDPTRLEYHDDRNPVSIQHAMIRMALRDLIKSIWTAEHNGGKCAQRRSARSTVSC